MTRLASAVVALSAALLLTTGPTPSGGCPAPVQWGSVTAATWDGLLAAGWHGDPGDHAEALHAPTCKIA